MHEAHQGRSTFGSCDVEKVKAVAAQETGSILLPSPHRSTMLLKSTAGRTYASNLAGHQKAGFRLLFHVLLALAFSRLRFTLFCAFYLLGLSLGPSYLTRSPCRRQGSVGGYLANAVTCWTSQCMLQTWTPLIIF